MEKHVAFALATIAAATLISHGALADTKATFACKGNQTIAATFKSDSVDLQAQRRAIAHPPSGDVRLGRPLRQCRRDPRLLE